MAGNDRTAKQKGEIHLTIKSEDHTDNIAKQETL